MQKFFVYAEDKSCILLARRTTTFPSMASLSEEAQTSPLRLCAQLAFPGDENECEFLKGTACCECACSRDQ
jgi:hypothetical protein